MIQVRDCRYRLPVDPGSSPSRHRNMKDLLETFPIFAGLTSAELDRVAQHCSNVRIERGEHLFKAGEAASALFVVRAGRIELHFDVVCYGATDLFVLDVKSAGDVCGWSALIPPHVFTLGAHAAEASELIRIDRTGLFACCEADTHLGYQVMKNIAGIVGERYQRTRQMLAGEIQNSLRQKDPLS